jgi:hypothetical protein
MNFPPNPNDNDRWTDPTGLTWVYDGQLGTWLLEGQDGPLAEFPPDEVV